MSQERPVRESFHRMPGTNPEWRYRVTISAALRDPLLPPTDPTDTIEVSVTGDDLAAAVEAAVARMCVRPATQPEREDTA